MKKKEILKRRKEFEAEMEPWRTSDFSDKGGLGGKTYLHSGVTTRNRSRSTKEQAQRYGDMSTSAGRNTKKQLKSILEREKEAKEKGLTEYEILKRKEKKKKKIRSFKPKKPVTGMLEAQGY